MFGNFCLFGNVCNQHVREWHAVTLLGKYYIYVCKLREKDATRQDFSERLKYKIIIEQDIAINSIDRFIEKWGILLHSLENSNCKV